MLMPARPLSRPALAGTTRPAGVGPARRALALLAAASVVVAGCASTGGDDAERAAQPEVGPTIAPMPSDDLVIPAEDASTPTIPIPPGFQAPDTRNVRLDPVLPEDVPQVDTEANLLPVEGGDATLRVTVRGPDGGAVEGAVVRFERFVGPYRGWLDVPAGEGGIAELKEARGGRYRLRAWERPTLATTDPQLVFVAADETVDLTVQVERHERRLLQGRSTVPSWQVGDVVAFEVLLVQEEVGADGIVRAAPLQGEVVVTPIAGAAVDGENRVVTDGAGFATVPVECLATGVHQVMLTSGDLLAGAEMPLCEPRPVDEEPEPPEDVEPDQDAPLDVPATVPAEEEPDAPTTTTTRPEASSPESSTTTTRPPLIAVGSTFAVPFEGPVPAGRYEPVAAGAREPEDCVTRFQVAAGGRWVRQEATGEIRVSSQARRFQAVDEGPECTYRRTQ